MIKSHKLLKNLLIIISFGLIAYVSVILMLKYNFIPGSYDQFLHINRIAEVKESLDHLSFSQFGYNNLRGSAIMTMYPYVNLVPFAILSFFIKNKILFIYVSFSIYIFLTLLISYYSSLYFSKSKCTSYLFSVIYSMSLMYISYIFITADFGEPAVLTWLPLIVFGFIKLIKTKTKWLELSIGMTLVIGTHVLSAFIVVALVIIWVLMNIKEITKRTMISISKTMGMTASATMVIWLPAILFMHENPSFIRPKSTEISNFSIPLSFLIKDSIIGRGIEGIDIFAIIGIVLGIMYFVHFSRYQKQMFIISTMIMLFCSKLFPWRIMPNFFTKFFDQFQFTTRFYIIPQLMLSYLFAVVIIKNAHTKNAKIGLSIITLLFAIGLQVRQQYIIMSFNQSLPAYNKMIINDARSKRINRFNHFSYGFTPRNKKNGIRLNLQSIYRITNNEDYRRLENVINDPIIFDYWPSKKLAPQVIGNRFSIDNQKRPFNPAQDVKSKGVSYRTDPSFKVYRSGFHRMRFYNPSHRRTNLMLPIFRYHGERFKLYDNHKEMRTVRGADTINVKDAPKKENHITLVPQSSYGLGISKVFSIISWIIYVVIIMFCFIKHLLRRAA